MKRLRRRERNNLGIRQNFLVPGASDHITCCGNERKANLERGHGSLDLEKLKGSTKVYQHDRRLFALDFLDQERSSERFKGNPASLLLDFCQLTGQFVKLFCDCFVVSL